ncbi:MAG: nitroreductase family protein [Acidimicrobiia bacterium]
MTDVWTVMRTARAIRRFTHDPVHDALLATCLEAATWAPSGGNQQPWHFVVMKSPEARQALAVGAARALATIEDVYRLSRPAPDDDSPRARNARATFALHDGAADVPAAVLFCVKDQPMTPPLHLGASIFPAMQNFLLAARASGLGTCVTGWQVPAQDEFRAAIGIPDGWHLASLVIVGWPIGKHGPLRRRPLDAVASLDRWDQPLASASSPRPGVPTSSPILGQPS